MIRKIEFRGIRKDNSKWAFGSLSVEYDGTCFISWWESILVEPENNYREMRQFNAEVLPETVGQHTEFEAEDSRKVCDGDIVEVCVFLVSPANPDDDQHFRGVITFDKGAFQIQLFAYYNWSTKEWQKLKDTNIPICDAELDEDGTFTVPFFEFCAISGNGGEYIPDNVKIIGDRFATPELIKQ